MKNKIINTKFKICEITYTTTTPINSNKIWDGTSGCIFVPYIMNSVDNETYLRESLYKNRRDKIEKMLSRK